MQAVYSFVLALSISTVLIPVLIRVAGTLGMTDLGGGRKVHTGLTPRTGGIAIVLGTLTSVFLLLPPRPDVSAFVGAASLLFVFGLLDDRLDLDYRLKLLGQSLAALVVTLVGGVVITHMPFLPDGTLPFLLSIPFTMFALVAVTNAINLSDGLDGLAAGISLLTVGSLILLAYQAGDTAAVTLGLAVMGATFGFLRFNTHPALLFMGDSGSQFLGFSAGVLAVVVTQHSNPALSPVTPVLLLGIPILDTLTVMTGRIARGQSPFAPDRTHLHHRLLAAGLNQSEAVTLIYGAQFVMVVLGYLLGNSADWLVLCVYMGCCALLLASIRLFERHRTRLLGRKKGASPLIGLASYLRRSRFLVRGPYIAANVLLAPVLAVGALIVPGVDKDVGVLAAVLLVVLLISLTLKSLPVVTVERLTAYVTAVTVVYLLNKDDWLRGLCTYCGPLLFGGLAVTAAVWVRFSTQRFTINAQDILILLIAITISSLPDLQFQNLGLVALESLILFYAIELLLEEGEHQWGVLRISLLVALSTLALKALWN